MKSLVFMTFFILAPVIFVSGQSDSVKMKLYYSYVRKTGIGKLSHVKAAYTYEFLDTALTFIGLDNYRKGTVPDPKYLYDIPVSRIERLSFRKRHPGKKAAVVISSGLVGGLIFGMVGYYTNGKDESAFFPATILGVFGAGIGIGIGTISTSIKVKIPIRGDRKTYEENRQRMEKYSIRYYER